MQLPSGSTRWLTSFRPYNIPLVPLLLVLALGGCASQPSTTQDASQPAAASGGTAMVGKVAPFPELPPPQRLEPGILLYEVSLPRPNGPSKLWIYIPEKPVATKFPCVFIAPAGSPLFYGGQLSNEDRPEQLPYVRAGFAVCAYELDGDPGKGANGRQIVEAVRQFKDAEAGLANARQAMDYVQGKASQIDPNRFYTAGHSSAGTASLLVAEHESRVKGCIAYAPVYNLMSRVSPRAINSLGAVIPDFKTFIEQSSPLTGVTLLHCPVFLFHADDDTNIPVSEITAFIAELRRTNQNVTYVDVPTGGHYDSMIHQGIPQGIRWLKKLVAAPQP